MKTRSQDVSWVSAIFLASFLACVLVLARWKSGAPQSGTALAPPPQTTPRLTAKLGVIWNASATAPEPQVLRLKAKLLVPPDEIQISSPLAVFDQIGPRVKAFGFPDHSVDLFDFRERPGVRVEELR